LFELATGSSRVSASDSSRPVVKVASLDHELVLRRHAVGLRSQHGNMDETTVGNGKSFIICTVFDSFMQAGTKSSLKSNYVHVHVQDSHTVCVCQRRRISFICNDEKINQLHLYKLLSHVVYMYSSSCMLL